MSLAKLADSSQVAHLEPQWDNFKMDGEAAAGAIAYSMSSSTAVGNYYEGEATHIGEFSVVLFFGLMA